MQINSSVNVGSKASVTLANNATAPSQKLDAINSAREPLTSNKNKSQQSESSHRSSQRLDIDPQVLSQVEQAQRSQSYSNNLQQNSQYTGQQINDRSGYDAPSSQNLSAVAAYQSVGRIAQRDSIQQVFGVDLFA